MICKNYKNVWSVLHSKFSSLPFPATSSLSPPLSIPFAVFTLGLCPFSSLPFSHLVSHFFFFPSLLRIFLYPSFHLLSTFPLPLFLSSTPSLPLLSYAPLSFCSSSPLSLTPSLPRWTHYSSVFTDHSAAIIALSRLPNLQGTDLDSPISEPPPTPLPPFMEDWLSTFNLWTLEHKKMALDAIVTM